MTYLRSPVPYARNPLMEAMSEPSASGQANQTHVGEVASGRPSAGRQSLNLLEVMAEERRPPTFGSPIQVASLWDIGIDQENGWMAGAVLLAGTIGAAAAVVGPVAITGVSAAWFAWLAGVIFVDIGIVDPQFLSTPFDIVASGIAKFAGANDFGEVTEWYELPELLANKIIDGNLLVPGGNNGEFMSAENFTKEYIMSKIQETGFAQAAQGISQNISAHYQSPNATLNGMHPQDYYNAVLNSTGGNKKLANEIMATAMFYYANNNKIEIRGRDGNIDLGPNFKQKENEMLRGFAKIGIDPGAPYDESGITMQEAARNVEMGGSFAAAHLVAWRSAQKRGLAPAETTSKTPGENVSDCKKLKDAEIEEVYKTLSTFPPNQFGENLNEAQLRMLYGEPQCEDEERNEADYRTVPVDSANRFIAGKSYRRNLDQLTPYQECIAWNNDWKNAHNAAAHGKFELLNALRFCEEPKRQAFITEAAYHGSTPGTDGRPPMGPDEHELDMRIHGGLMPEGTTDLPIAGAVAAAGFAVATSAITASTAGAGPLVAAFGAAFTAFLTGEESLRGFPGFKARPPTVHMPRSDEALVVEIMRTSPTQLGFNKENLVPTEYGYLWDQQRSMYYDPETHTYSHARPGFDANQKLQDDSDRWIPADVNNGIYLDRLSLDSENKPMPYSIQTEQYQAYDNDNIMVPYDPRVAPTQDDIVAYARRIYRPDVNPRAFDESASGNTDASQGFITTDPDLEQGEGGPAQN